MKKAILSVLLAALVPLIAACHLLPLIFGQSPSLDGQWQVEHTFTGGGTSYGCVVVSGQRITQTGYCDATPDTITDHPVAVANGAHVTIEVTTSILGGGSALREVFELEWQFAGTLVGTASSTINTGTPTMSNVVWRRR